jgi:hypothetical protein
LKVANQTLPQQLLSKLPQHLCASTHNSWDTNSIAVTARTSHGTQTALLCQHAQVMGHKQHCCASTHKSWDTNSIASHGTQTALRVMEHKQHCKSWDTNSIAVTALLLICIDLYLSPKYCAHQRCPTRKQKRQTKASLHLHLGLARTVYIHRGGRLGLGICQKCSFFALRSQPFTAPSAD